MTMLLQGRLFQALGRAAVVAFLITTTAYSASPEQATSQPHQTYADGVVGLPDVIYQSIPDFHPLKADLYLPAAASGVHSVVVWVHGGGWGVGDPRMGSGGQYGPWPQTLATLASRGHVVMAINYRFTGEARFPAQIQDVKAAIRWIRSNAAQYGADPSHIYIWGGSAGGYLAALAGTSCGADILEPLSPVRPGPPVPGMVTLKVDPHQSDCVQGVVDWYGPTDFRQMDAQSLPNSMQHNVATGAESKLLGCTLPSCPTDRLQQSNPLTYISASTPPFLIMHGTADHSVPTKQSEELYRALVSKGVTAKYIAVTDADHGFRGATPQVMTQLIDRVFQWLDHPGGNGQETVQSGAPPGGPPPGPP